MPIECLKNIEVEDYYEGRGSEITAKIIVPLLRHASSYDRITSFFTSESLVATAEGVDSLWQRQGRMRLLLGIHDVPADIAHAATEQSWVDALVVAARASVLDRCTRLTDELQRNRIGTLAMMMREGFLEVSVGAPRWRDGKPSRGILHNKRLIWRDKCGHTVIAVGSANETGAALSDNSEELVVDTSWGHSSRIGKLQASFEKLWAGEREEILVRRLDASFAEDLLKALGKPPKGMAGRLTRSPQIDSRIAAIFRILRESPEFAFANVARAALFPHQERALRDAVSRAPIRAILADEVGLGKTIEAGCVIAYARRFRGVRRVLLLTPASLVRQWQSELDNHFNVHAHRYDGAAGGFLSIADELVPSKGDNPLDTAPDTAIVSWHLARGSWSDRHIFEKSSWRPDLIVVDEAHAARRQRGSDGSYRTTQVWKMIRELSRICPNLLLLTATPMQLQVEEYHGLMLLLGLPKWWQDSMHLNDLLEHLGKSNPRYELSTIKLLGDALASSTAMTNYEQQSLPNVERNVMKILGSAETISPETAIKLLGQSSTLEDLAIKYTPPSLLTIRNTRRGLESIGYKFPKRVFHTPALTLNEPGRLYLRHVESYLSEIHGRVEMELGLVKGSAIGFLRSTYYQRVVSSLTSAERTLQRRRRKLEEFIETGVIGETYFSDDSGDDSDEVDLDSNTINREGVQQATQLARIEIQYLDEMLRYLGEAASLGDDPKLSTLRATVSACIKANDSILVFSRFTDTVDACVAALAPFLRDIRIGYGSYTGDGGWAEIDGLRQSRDKTALRHALHDRSIRVLFCSDAASEGLNLQAARVIINVDVPWNPAKLEQRIGRIARLGQRAATVDVYNLWYPGTVEQRMYEVLIGRQDLYNLAVGEFPDVVGAEIRQHLTNGNSGVPDVASLLSSKRNLLELEALRRIWSRENGNFSVGQEFRSAMFDLIVELARSKGLLERETRQGNSVSSATVRVDAKKLNLIRDEGEQESLSIYHDVMAIITQSAVAERSLLDELRVVTRDGMPICIAFAQSECLYVLSPIQVVKVLAHILLDEPRPDLTSTLPIKDSLTVANLNYGLRAAFPNRIESNQIRIQIENSIEIPTKTESQVVEIHKLDDWVNKSEMLNQI